MTNKITSIIKTFLLVSIMLVSMIPFGSAQGFGNDFGFCSVSAYSLESWRGKGIFVDDDILFETILDTTRDVDTNSLSVDWFFGNSQQELNGWTETTGSYLFSGTYYVGAEVSGSYTDGTGFTMDCFSKTVTVSDLPEIKVDFSPKEAIVEFPVTLTANDQDYPRPLRYVWTIDEKTVEGKSVTHTFANPSTDSEENVVILEIIDDRTLDNSKSDDITVNVIAQSPEGPQVTLTASGKTLVAVGDSVTFTATATDDQSDLMSFDFDFDGFEDENNFVLVNDVAGIKTDTRYSFQATASHIFTQEGSYEVDVLVTNKFGEKVESSVVTINVVQLANARPVAFATADQYFGNAPLDVNFEGSDSFDPDGKQIISYEWTITNRDDPSFVDYEFGEFTSYSFNEPGVYDVKLVVADEEFATSNEFKLTITVNKPEVNFAPVIPSVGNQTAYRGESYTQKIFAYDVYDSDVTYSATGLPDGLFITTIRDEVFQRNVGVIQGTPAKLGDYEVKLTVTDTQGLSSEETFFINVIERPFETEHVTGLVITRANLDKVYLNIGEMITTNIKLENDGTEDFEDLKITASIAQLGVLKTFTVRELNNDNSDAQLLGLEIPEYAPNGEYSVKITVSNDDVRRTLHRTFWIVD